MTYIPISEFTDKMWYELYLTVYDTEMAYLMGVDPRFLTNPPSLTQFYDNITAAVEAGVAYGFGVQEEDSLLGYIILDKRSGEWEGSVVVRDKKKWNLGIGVKMALRAGKWIFEEQKAEWAVAYTMGKDPKVKRMALRAGFKPFMNFLVMDRATWDERWSGRSE